MKAKILANKKVSAECYCLSLLCPSIGRRIKPGQFVNLRISDGLDPFLRRPFSVHRHGRRSSGKKTIEILYKIVGKGTTLLSRKRPGEGLDVIGPLGNGFSLPVFSEQTAPVLVGGGMGAAPLYALAEEMKKGSRVKGQGVKGEIYVVIGAKTGKELLAIEDFKKLGTKVLVTTEDGSAGKKGLASDALKELLSEKKFKALVFACGPKAMLKEVARMTAKEEIPCQVSLEEFMACGVGVCRGCVVKIRTKNSELRTKKKEDFVYKTVCKDGPVFWADEIIW